MNADLLSFLGTVIVAVLAFAGTYISNHKSNAIWQYRVKQLEEKQDKHNSVIERTYELEKKVGEQERDVKTAFHQIDDIKNSVEKVDENVSRLGEEVQNIRESGVRIEAQLEAQMTSKKE